MKIFVSQSMRGLTHEEITKRRDLIIDKYKRNSPKEVEVIESYLPELVHAHPISAVSKSLSLLAEADLVLVDLNAFEKYPYPQTDMTINKIKGQQLEYICAINYGIRVLFYTIEKGIDNYEWVFFYYDEQI